MFLLYDELKKKADTYVGFLDAEWAKAEPDYARIQLLNQTLAAVFECQRECRMRDVNLLAQQREERIADKDERKAKLEAERSERAKKRRASKD